VLLEVASSALLIEATLAIIAKWMQTHIGCAQPSDLRQHVSQAVKLGGSQATLGRG
jgi:hypothetical protein